MLKEEIKGENIDIKDNTSASLPTCEEDQPARQYEMYPEYDKEEIKYLDTDIEDDFLPSLPICEEYQLARFYLVHPE